jgi:hypothetical protein
MVDVHCGVDTTPCPTATDNSRYETDKAGVIYWGGCPEWLAVALCRPKTDAATGLVPHAR